MNLCLATGNKNKEAEFAKIISFNKSDIKLLSAKEFGGVPAVDETGETFKENAYLKSIALKIKLPNYVWSLADDSGLSVEILDGKPGVKSARYAGENSSDSENIQKLLYDLKKITSEKVNAKFVCWLCLIGPDDRIRYFMGKCEGSIVSQPSGTNGFGYDPIFQPNGYLKTFSELGSEIKNKISHRANAFTNFMNWHKNY